MVSEEEYREAMGMGLEDLKRAVYDKLGSAEAAMEAMDKNKDGVISKEEFVNELKKAGFGEKEAADMFDELAGEDGKLTAEDWAKATGAEDLAEQREAAGVGDEEAMPGVPLPPSGAESDADGDGIITEKEYIEAAKAKGMSEEEAKEHFDAMDTDGDGVVTEEQLAAAREKTKDAAADFIAADSDGDGMLSEEEFMAAAAEKGIPDEEALEMFKRMDKDGDGQISPKEFALGGGFAETEGATTPAPIEVEALPMDEVSSRMKAAFGTTAEAWEDME